MTLTNDGSGACARRHVYPFVPGLSGLRDFLQDDNRDRWQARLRRFLLDLDSRIDFGLYQAKTWGRELYERFTVFMDRFHVAGWRRWYFVEPISEGAHARHRRPGR